VATLLENVLHQLKAERRKALVAYLTAGDPNLAFTSEIIPALANAGVNAIELGVPFADPVGDGPVIQDSVQRALQHDVAIGDVLKLVGRVRENGTEIPIVLFSYHNPVFSFGYERLAKEAREVGVSGVLVVDLPPEESSEYCAVFNKAGVNTVFLATPLTEEKRLPLVDECTSGFCYYVSRTGTTGGAHRISRTLGAEIARVKTFISTPILVGFGIQTPEHARKVGQIADGVIVGSAFVECIARARDENDAKFQIIALARRLREGLDQSDEIGK